MEREGDGRWGREGKTEKVRERVCKRARESESVRERE